MLTMISFNKTSDAEWDPIRNYSSDRIHMKKETKICYVWGKMDFVLEVRK